MRFQQVFLLMTILSSAYCDCVEDDYNEYCPLVEQNYCDTTSLVDLNKIKSLSDSVDTYLELYEEQSRHLPSSLAYFNTRLEIQTNRKFMKLTSYSNFLLKSISSSNTTLFSDESTKSFGWKVPKHKYRVSWDAVSVNIVNSRTLPIFLKHNPNVINYYTPKDYLLVFFFTKPCRFSDLAAPHFKLLSKFFPQLEMVAYYYGNDDWFNSLVSYGVNGFPSVFLFRNGKLETIHNDSYSLIAMTQLILNHTDLRPSKKIVITADDFIRYVNLLPKFDVEDYDYYLILSWFTILFWTVVYFGKIIILNVLDRIIIASESLKNYIINNHGDEHLHDVVNEQFLHNDGNENLHNGSNEDSHTDTDEIPHDDGQKVRQPQYFDEEYFLSRHRHNVHNRNGSLSYHRKGYTIWR